MHASLLFHLAHHLVNACFPGFQRRSGVIESVIDVWVGQATSCRCLVIQTFQSFNGLIVQFLGLSHPAKYRSPGSNWIE